MPRGTTKTEAKTYQERHREAVIKQVGLLESKGFRCVRVDSRPIPDIIAIKDGKVIAVEIKEGKCERPWFGKYKGFRGYDDVWWILHGVLASRRPHFMTNPNSRANISKLMKGRKITWVAKIVKRRWGYDYKPRIRPCLNCGLEYKAWKRPQKFCCRRCASLWWVKGRPTTSRFPQGEAAVHQTVWRPRR